MCDNARVDRSQGYNRGMRKALHILAGLPALGLPYIGLCPYGWYVAAALALGGLWFAYSLKPSHSRWLRYISKPADRNRGVITGLRGYAVVIVILLLLWYPLGFVDAAALRYVMFGWLALAWADGLAGLLGPSPRQGGTVPWNRHKTWWGFFGAVIGAATAYAVAFLAPWPGVPLAELRWPLATGVVTALVVAVLESLKLRIDDNYLVGLGAPLAVLTFHLLAGYVI